MAASLEYGFVLALPALWWILAVASFWSYFRVRWISVLVMGIGSTLIAFSTSAGTWFGPSFSLAADGVAEQTSRGLLSAELQSRLSGAGLLMFAIATVVLLISTQRSR